MLPYRYVGNILDADANIFGMYILTACIDLPIISQQLASRLAPPLAEC